MFYIEFIFKKIFFLFVMFIAFVSFTTLCDTFQLHTLSIASFAQSVIKSADNKELDNPSDKFIQEILTDTEPSKSESSKTEPPMSEQDKGSISKTSEKLLPSDSTQEDFIEDPEALLDEITEQIDTDQLLKEDTQQTKTTGHLKNPTEEKLSVDTLKEVSQENQDEVTENDFFSVIDNTDTIKTKNKEFILEEEPDNNGVDASTIPTAIDNDILLEAIDAQTSSNTEVEFSDDITDKSVRKFSNPLIENTRTTKETKNQHNPPKENAPENKKNVKKPSKLDASSEDIFKLPDSIDTISDLSDAQTNQTGILPNSIDINAPLNDIDINDLYKPFRDDDNNKEDTKGNKNTDAKNNNQNTGKPQEKSMVFDNQDFTCQFEETIDSENQEQSYKLTLTPQKEPKTPIVLSTKSKMELHQYFDANTDNNSRSQMEFSILQHFCTKIIVQKSVSEAY